jgi:hypothetical protein
MAIFRSLLRHLRARPQRVAKREPNMRMRRLRSGAIAYYWHPRKRAKKDGLPIHAEALGTDWDSAVTRARKLNALYHSLARRKTKKLSKSTSVVAEFAVTEQALAITETVSSAVTEAASERELEKVA